MAHLDDFSGNDIHVIYVVGHGRSGSTLLNTVLENHPDIVGAGELSQIVRIGCIDGEYCACGRVVGDCPFWQSVIRLWEEECGKDVVERCRLAQRHFERFRFWYRIYFGEIFRSKRIMEYGRLCRGMYVAIAKASGKRYIVDSSKNPSRLLALSKSSGLKVTAVHLIRDCRGVALSLHKSYKKNIKAGVPTNLRSTPVVKTALSWILVNFQAALIIRQRQVRNRAVVRYEDLVQHPAVALKAIGDSMGLSCRMLIEKIQNCTPFAPGHTVAGNRMRMVKEVSIQLDDSWHVQLLPNDRKTVWRVAGWLARRYGYAKVPAGQSRQ